MHPTLLFYSVQHQIISLSLTPDNFTLQGDGAALNGLIRLSVHESVNHLRHKWQCTLMYPTLLFYVHVQRQMTLFVKGRVLPLNGL